METIKFVGIPESQLKTMVETFNFIDAGKRKGNIDESALRELLGQLYLKNLYLPKLKLISG